MIDVTAGLRFAGHGEHGGGNGIGGDGAILPQLSEKGDLSYASGRYRRGFGETPLGALAGQQAGAKNVDRFEGLRADRLLHLRFDAQIEVAGLGVGSDRGDEDELFGSSGGAAFSDDSGVVEIYFEKGMLRAGARDRGSQGAEDVRRGEWIE